MHHFSESECSPLAALAAAAASFSVEGHTYINPEAHGYVYWTFHTIFLTLNIFQLYPTFSLFFFLFCCFFSFFLDNRETSKVSFGLIRFSCQVHLQVPDPCFLLFNFFSVREETHSYTSFVSLWLSLVQFILQHKIHLLCYKMWFWHFSIQETDGYFTIHITLRRLIIMATLFIKTFSELTFWHHTYLSLLDSCLGWSSISMCVTFFDFWDTLLGFSISIKPSTPARLLCQQKGSCSLTWKLWM